MSAMRRADGADWFVPRKAELPLRIRFQKTLNFAVRVKTRPALRDQRYARDGLQASVSDARQGRRVGQTKPVDHPAITTWHP